jgi:glutamate carboxypeptidase
MTHLLPYFQDQRAWMIDTLMTLVNHETPSTDKPSLDRLGAYIERVFLELGASSIQRFAQTETGDQILAKWKESAPGLPILFLVHIDTVWPLGTLAGRPVRIDDDGRLFGPGAIDMKAGITVALAALRGLRERGELPDRPIWFLVTPDEEIGSPYSKPIIEQIARQCGLVLVMEPATPNEALKVARKGIATYHIEIQGRPAHAGNAPEKGLNAIIEFAQQALKLHAMNDLKYGTSVSVTLVNGGSAANVIPEFVRASVDARFLTAQAMEDTNAQIMALEPFIPGVQVRVTRSHGHPPMENNAQMQANFAQCKAIGERIGVTVRGESVGGASDGSTVASLGISVLDGMGPQGDGLHALDEHVILNSMPRRAALIAALLREWVF